MAKGHLKSVPLAFWVRAVRTSYFPHVAQFPPPHEPQPPLPATRWLAPPSLLMAAQTEIARWTVSAAQRGQAIGAAAWLIGRSASKRLSQAEQRYS